MQIAEQPELWGSVPAPLAYASAAAAVGRHANTPQRTAAELPACFVRLCGAAEAGRYCILLLLRL